MSAQRYRIDTNVLLRFLRGDHPQHSPAARSLFDSAASGRCTVVLDAVVIAESIWVLSSFYKTDRARIAEALIALLAHPGIRCDDQEIILDALERFGTRNIDFVDCHLAARAAAGREAVVSFDAHMRRFEDVVVLTPGAQD